MGVKEQLLINFKDTLTFGPSFLLRHLGRLRSSKIVRVSVPEVGPVYIRIGESDVAVLRQVFGERQYDIRWPPQLRDRIEHRYKQILSEGSKPIIVDAGANIGAASLFFGFRFPEAAIVSIEPDPGNLEILRKNVGHRPNHVIVEAAVGSETGFAELVNDGLGWAVQTKRSAAGTRVVTVQDAYTASGGDTPFIVKIDIEGFERDLFSSNTDWVDGCQAVFIEPHDWMLPGQQTSSAFQKVMGSKGFEMFLLGDNLLYVNV